MGTNEFRLICYNLLAFLYSGTESARTYFFRHCPPAYLEPKYRFPLIYRELLSYKADILCLQEVDTAHFQRRLFFLLQQAGDFEGCFLNKLLINVPSTLSSLPPPEPIASYPRKVRMCPAFALPSTQLSALTPHCWRAELLLGRLVT